MPVPIVPAGVSKLQTNRIRRGLFTTVLLTGILPAGLETQGQDASPLKQIRLDSAVGDIPASPWSRRNNPARQASIDFESTVSQPSADPPNRFTETSRQEIRLGDSTSRRSQIVSPPSSSSIPATIRWGAIQAPTSSATLHTATSSSTIGPSDTLPPQPSDGPLHRDMRSKQGKSQDDSLEYTDADTIVKLDVDTESTESYSSRSIETNASQLKASGRNSTSKVEPWVKQAATRSHSASTNAELNLGDPVISTREGSSNQSASPTNSRIRLVPNDTIQIDNSREVATPFDPMFTNGDLIAPTNQEKDGAKRMLVAQRLSHELLSQNQMPPARAPQPVENPTGWQSIERELRTNLEKCDQLLRRGAVHSARSEVISGLRRLFRSLDAYRGSFSSEPALDLALTAFREEADFHSRYGISSVASVVETHTTPALKNRPLDGVSPEVASQHYRGFAGHQWIVASCGHRWASDLLYALGKTYEQEAELSSTSSIRLRSQAVICYQSAIRITPNQSEASNQFGYALIHLDRIEEAYDALKASLESQPNPQAWSNLAEVYRRRGATDSANFAVQQASSLAQRTAPAFTAENPEITQVDPNVFARYSPAQNVIAPTSSANLATTATQVATQPNFFSKMFAR